MEQVRDLNMEADDMQVVLSALKGVSKRIKEVAQTHKPLFGGEHFLTGKEVCERGCVKIDTSSFLFFLYLVYHIIHYLLQLCC